MFKSKRIFALLIAIVLMLSLFSSCTKDPSKDSSKSDENGKQETEKSDDKKGDDPVGEDFAGYPIEKEGASLRLWTSQLGYHSDYTSEEESPYHQYLSEFTGVDIIWERPAAGEDAEQAYNLLLASGDLPDIIYRGGLPSRIETLIEEGHVITLDDEMPQFAPALYSYLEANPDVMRAVKSDSGHLYNFPFLRDDVVWQGSYVGNVINTDVLSKTGLDKPVTIDEWKDVFYAMKDECDIVFATNAMLRLKLLFANAFDISFDNYYIDNGKVSDSFSGEGYYNFLKMANEFYKDGLIDPDFVTADTASFSETFVASKIGIATTGTVTFGYVYDQVVERDGSWDYEPIPYPVPTEGAPIKHVQGEAIWTGNGAVITSACEDVELAMRFLDYGYTDEGIITWNFGKEGESFEFVDGVPTLLPVITEAAEGVSEAAKRYTSMTANGISFMDLEFNRQRNLDFANQVTDVCTANTEEAVNYRMPPISATEAEGRETADIQATIDAYVEEMYVGFITGTQSLDNYDEYEKTLEDMNLERLLEIKQEQLDRYNSR
ncbi:MAG: extracellular solute-binding protein [Clostridiales bacterium]|nr:extracellular solute-binding protein [Clostridiales bacterium]